MGATPEVSPSNRNCGDCLVPKDPVRGTLEPGPSSLGIGPAVEQTGMEFNGKQYSLVCPVFRQWLTSSWLHGAVPASRRSRGRQGGNPEKEWLVDCSLEAVPLVFN